MYIHRNIDGTTSFIQGLNVATLSGDIITLDRLMATKLRVARAHLKIRHLRVSQLCIIGDVDIEIDQISDKSKLIIDTEHAGENARVCVQGTSLDLSKRDIQLSVPTKKKSFTEKVQKVNAEKEYALAIKYK